MSSWNERQRNPPTTHIWNEALQINITTKKNILNELNRTIYYCKQVHFVSHEIFIILKLRERCC